MNRKLILTLGALLVAGALIGCGSSYNNPMSPTPPPPGGSAATLTITILAMNGAQSFSPNPSSIVAGQSVAWKNNDTIVHHIVPDSGTSFDTGDLAPGATSAPFTMSTAGPYPYHCSIHPTMVGTLNVTSY